MNKAVLYIVAGVIVLVGGFYALNSYIYKEKLGEGPAKSHKDATYVIDGAAVRLVGGIAETEAAPGSASKITTRYFGNEVRKDLDGDGREDVVFVLTHETGGSGTFFYVVAALNTEAGYVGSQGLLLGDRIAPQTTESSSGKVVVVNYADRAPGEPFTALPSVGKSIGLVLDVETMQFGEVAQDFEGEADPETMSLAMKTWVWISALYNDGKELQPAKAGVFTLTFQNDGTFSATTDCNSTSGSYQASGGAISFSSIASTQMYCAGSQEADFASLLQNAERYHFTSKGELVFGIKFDSGSAIFR